MNEVFFNVILGLIPVIGVVITGFIIPLIMSKLGAEKLATVVKWVGYAVSAAEMIFPEVKSGEAKKQYVIDFIDKLFNQKKVVITKEQISVLIESIVNEMNKDKKVTLSDR
jgi:LL-H family phage holin